MPAARVMSRGTHSHMPRSRLSRPAIGEPECQTPSRRWPRVRTITGARWPPAVRHDSVARSSDMICSA